MKKKKSVNKKSKGTEIKKTGKKIYSISERTNIAWKNFTFFLMIFILSFILYSISLNDLLRNFFQILSVILGFLTFAFLIAFIVLSILKTSSNKAKSK